LTERSGPVSSPVYFQRRVDGPSFSATFIGRAGSARLIGVARQWIGIPGWPFVYRGSLGPCPIAADLEGRLAAMGNRLVDAFGLIGWFSVDYVLRDGIPWAVEVNPRYTASLEIHELASGRSLLRAHRDACEGDGSLRFPPSVSPADGRTRLLPSRSMPPCLQTARTEPRPPEQEETALGTEGHRLDSVPPASDPSRVVAKRVLYAARRFLMPEGIDCERVGDLFAVPPIADIPSPGTLIEAGEPVMTVFAEDAEPAICRARLTRRERYWCRRIGLIPLSR
jgi:predicted ATP-grasp superfamily ATP-dependent carboligase